MLKNVLETASDSFLSDAVLTSYKEIEENYVLRKWKPSELEAGHFVEAVRRFIDYKLFGSYTPIDQKLDPFNDQVLRKYEQAKGDESYRITIPRVLKSIANIRNKRGVGHLGAISPNKMDATLLLYNVKWVLAELVRLNSTLSPDESQAIISSIIERQLEVIWTEEEITRVINTKMKISEQILLLLYKTSPQKSTDLLSITEYANKTRFKNLLRTLHKNRLLEYKNDEDCLISPSGKIEAENILLKYGYL